MQIGQVLQLTADQLQGIAPLFGEIWSRGKAKKQSVVARSSGQAKFRAMPLRICKGIWLRRLLFELRIPIEESISLLCNNQAALSIARNPIHRDKTKHVEIDRHL